MSDRDDADERPTEGVRIIGAQEAAEAADRADIVRRRRGKRYGDRPDTPEPATDLPKITISTTEGEVEDRPDRFGAVPVVRPDMPRPEEPRWSSSDEEAGGRESGFGHARIVEESAGRGGAEGAGLHDEPTQAWSIHEEGAEAHGEAGDAASGAEPASATGAGTSEEGWSASQEEWSAPEPARDEWSGDVTSEGAWSASEEEWSDRGPTADEWSGSLVDDPADDEPAHDDRGDDVPDDGGGPPSSEEPVFSFGTGDHAASDDAFASSDDSFVLPHWTEPPTGQVPKVVVGEDAEDPEPLATYGSQPRWRDQGERSTVEGFDDLVDDAPRLGALGGTDDGTDPDEDDDFFADGPYTDSHCVTDAEGVDEGFDELAAPPRRPRRRSRGDADAGGPAGPTRGSGGGDRNLVTAVAVGVGLVAVALASFALGTITTTLLATVVVGAAAFEYYTAVRSAGHNPATLLGAVAVAGLMIGTASGGLAAYPVVIGLTVLGGLLWYLWVAPGEGAVANLGLTFLGVLWIGVLGSFSTLFLGLGRVAQDASAAVTSNPGIGVLIAAAIAAVSHDVGAYFVGKYLGRTPLSATSPNKTQEGLAGGVLSSLVVTFVVVGLIGIEPIGGALGEAFIFALLCAMVAPLGDLCESLIKRDLRIKDMGSVLPGHGGVLDRFDALLFVLPVAYFVTVLFDTWRTVGG